MSKWPQLNGSLDTDQVGRITQKLKETPRRLGFVVFVLVVH